MKWIFISPHFDDVALSCGGLVWELTQVGNEVSIWTIFGGIPAQTLHSPIIETLHKRWKSSDQAIKIRRQEDIRSCQVLNATANHFDALDCIYRVDENGNPMYPTEESLFGPIDNNDAVIIDRLAQELDPMIPNAAEVVCPLAIGNHVDHQLSRQIIQKIRRYPWFYADIPYIFKSQSRLKNLSPEGWTNKIFSISGQGYQAWLNSVLAHQSQISSFWRNKQEMNTAFRQYLQKNQGIPLWRSN